MDQEQELTLVKKARNGDRQALGMLWDALTPRLFGYLVNVTRDKTLAEDLLQSTWLKAIEALPRFQSRGYRISAWLFAIAKNECRQHWRKTQHETDRPIAENDIIGDDQSSTDNTIIIDQLLNRLSEDDRELLRLRYIADLPLNEVARVLNINSVAVRVRMHRALARARAAVN